MHNRFFLRKKSLNLAFVCGSGSNGPGRIRVKDPAVDGTCGRGRMEIEDGGFDGTASAIMLM